MASAPLTVRTVQTRKYQHESRKQLQERGPEIESQFGRFTGNANPMRIPDKLGLIETREAGGDRPGNDADQRRPGARLRC